MVMVKGSPKALAAGQKAKETKLLHLRQMQINKPYTGKGKTKFRNMVVDEFEKRELTLCLESEQMLFVDLLPDCNFVIYEKDSRVYRCIKSYNRPNIRIYNQNVSMAGRLKVDFKQAFIDVFGTFDSNVSMLKSIRPALKNCNCIAFTFSTRNPRKGDVIGQQHYRIYAGLESIFPQFKITIVQPYSDGCAMIGIIMRRKEFGEITVKTVLEEHKTTVRKTMTFQQFRNLLIKQMLLQGDKTFAQIGAEVFPPLSKQQVRDIAQRYGIRRESPGMAWSIDEIDFLKRNYTTMSIEDISVELQRSRNAVITKAKELHITTGRGVAARKFTEAEISFIKDNPNLSAKDVAKKLNRSIMGIYYQWRILGISNKQTERERWTDEEKEILNQNYSIEQLQEKLPGRTTHAIKMQLWKLSDKPCDGSKWSPTEDEMKILQDTSLNVTVKSGMLHHDRKTIREKMDKYNIPYKSPYANRNRINAQFQPCPLCGSTHVVRHGQSKRTGGFVWQFRCKECWKYFYVPVAQLAMETKMSTTVVIPA